MPPGPPSSAAAVPTSGRAVDQRPNDWAAAAVRLAAPGIVTRSRRPAVWAASRASSRPSRPGGGRAPQERHSERGRGQQSSARAGPVPVPSPAGPWPRDWWGGGRGRRSGVRRALAARHGCAVAGREHRPWRSRPRGDRPPHMNRACAPHGGAVACGRRCGAVVWRASWSGACAEGGGAGQAQAGRQGRARRARASQMGWEALWLHRGRLVRHGWALSSEARPGEAGMLRTGRPPAVQTRPGRAQVPTKQRAGLVRQGKQATRLSAFPSARGSIKHGAASSRRGRGPRAAAGTATIAGSTDAWHSLPRRLDVQALRSGKHSCTANRTPHCKLA